VKILDPSGTRTPDLSVVQHVASRYTDCAIQKERIKEGEKSKKKRKGEKEREKRTKTWA
jgi:hypothetical protein